jgi:hypothetical protein
MLTIKHNWIKIIATDTGHIMYQCTKCNDWKLDREPRQDTNCIKLKRY